MDAIKFFKYLFQILFLHAYAVVADADFELFVANIASGDRQLWCHILAAIFDGVVKEVENHISEVHLVNIHYRVFGREVGGDMASEFFSLDAIGAHHIVDNGVGINIF